MSTQKIIGMFLSMLLCVSVASGTTYYVDENGSDEADGLSWATAFATIQHGIDVAGNYNVVEVNEGTYYGAVDFNGTACTVRSKDPNDWNVVAATVIDFNASRSEPNCILFINGEDSNSVLLGITVTDGYGYYSQGFYAGGAIFCNGSSPTIRRCILKDNMNDKAVSSWDTDGGAIACYGGSNPLIENCIISDNEAHYGGGIGVRNSSPTIRNCMIFSNGAGDAGGALCVHSGNNITVSNCTIVNNSADGSVGGIGGSTTVTNCILWGNGDDLHGCSATYSCIEDNDSGTGNIHSDPNFIDPNNNNFHIDANSPCFDKGDPNGNYDGQTDIDGEARLKFQYVDIGADEFCSTSTVKNIDKNKWYEHIQDAIDDSSNGNEIVAYPGTYYESVDFDGKEITLRSIDPNDWGFVEATVIDCEGSRQSPRCGFIFSNGEDSNSVLEGFTITNGYGQLHDGWYAGGAIYCEGSSPTIRQCILKDNMNDKINNDTDGGAISCYNAAEPLIENCRIFDNEAAWGGGISVWNSSPVIRNCIISNNSTTEAGGIGIWECNNVEVNNCTIVKNSADMDGGGIYSFYSTQTVVNCILWGNGDDLHGCSATYSCIEDGDSGTGNISSYPYFADYDANNFHLTWNSPCINRGDPNGFYTGESDIDGEERVIDGRVDMGADELNTNFPNLVKNPGFEMVDGSNPSYWTFAPVGSGGSADINDNDSNSGYNSWQFTQENSSGYCRGVSDLIPIEPGKYYKLSGCIKGESDPNHIYLQWWEYDANGTELPIDYRYNALIDAQPTEWTHYSGAWLVENAATKYLKVKLIGPFRSEATVWWDDISLTEIGTLYLPPYGCVNEPDIAETVEFGGDEKNVNWVSNINVMSGKLTDADDENITYRELKAGETLTVGFPYFNLDPNYDPCNPNDINSLPLTPMLLEIMFKDTVYTTRDSNMVYVYSKIDYINLDPDYLRWNSDQDYYLAYLGGLKDYDWKYMQCGLQKSHYQLLRAIDGKFTIKIKNDSDKNIPISYISLRAITQNEYEAISNKQRSLIGFYEVDLPSDSPSSPPDYNELTVFVRDIMRPVYRHTKPALNEPNVIAGFSAWGEVEPMSFSIYSENDVNDVNITVSNLTHESVSEANIPADNIRVYEVVYDETRLHYVDNGIKGYALLPDRLEEFTSLSIDPNTSKRIWLKVRVPDEGADLPAGLYKGQVTISRPGKSNIYIPIYFTVYDIVLDGPAAAYPVSTGPYSRIYSSNIDVVFEAYSETGFDPFTCPINHYIRADFNNGEWDFNSVRFGQAVDRMIAEGYAKDTIVIWIQSGNIRQYTSDLYPNYDPNLYFSLSEPNFKTGFGLYVEEYINTVHAKDPNITVRFFVVDEPGIKPRSRIFADRLFNIIHDHNGLTTATYYTTCDEPLYINPNEYIIDPNLNCWLPALTDLVDYKVWSMKYQHDGYTNHQDSNYHGQFGYYTTGHSHYRNPIYNRFLHGLFAFRTDAAVVSAYAMGSYPHYFSDPYNDFDVFRGDHYIYPFPYPDFLFAYPTWSGELLYTVGGLEGIREGIKDAKYIATLENLIAIAEDPNNPSVVEAQAYLDEIKSRINPNYDATYSDHYTELGYYGAILEGISEVNDTDDFEAFTRIRKDIAEYIVLLSSLASEPNPADGTANMDINTSLSWTPGQCALSYDVYLGTDWDDVNDATPDSNEYMDSNDVNSFEPGGLDYNTTYYWRIDSNTAVGTAKGSVWSFTTVPPPSVSIIGSWVSGTSHAKESGTNRALIFIAHAEDTGYQPIALNSVSYGGQQMTKVIEREISTGWWWYRTRAYVVAFILDEEGVNAASGSTFTVSWNQTPDYSAYSSVFLGNVNQTTLTGASASNTSTSGATISTSALATNDGDMVIDAATCGNSGSYTLNNGFTESTEQTMGNTATGATGYKSGTGANETPSATFSGNMNRQVLIGFVVRSSMY